MFERKTVSFPYLVGGHASPETLVVGGDVQVVGLVHQGLRVYPGRRPEGRAAAVARQQDIRKVLKGLLEAREGGVCGRGARSCHECVMRLRGDVADLFT